MALASTQSHGKPFLDWHGWDSRRSPQFFARVGRLVVVDRWKVETGTRFPTLTQLLAILKGLGYRRVVD